MLQNAIEHLATLATADTELGIDLSLRVSQLVIFVSNMESCKDRHLKRIDRQCA